MAVDIKTEVPRDLARSSYQILHSDPASRTDLSHLLELPPEVYSYFALKISARIDLKSTFALVCTCKSLYHSTTGQSIRFLWGLHKQNNPPPRRLPLDLEREATSLIDCSWPPDQPTSDGVFYFGPNDMGRDQQVELNSLRIDGGHVYGISEDRNIWYHWNVCIGCAKEEKFRLVSSFECHRPIDRYDVDTDEGVVAIMTVSDVSVENTEDDGAEKQDSSESGMQAREVEVQIVDIQEGHVLSRAPHRMVLSFDLSTLHVEVLSSNLLIRAGNHVAVHRWKDATTSSWPLLWTRSSDPSTTLSTILTCHLLGLDIIVVLSQPLSSDHGQDWGSTLEFYQFTQTSSPRIADIRLPIRSKPVKNLSYIKTGLNKRLRSIQDDSLIIICVEGFIWVSDLNPFLELLFPQNALSIFGNGYPILDSHWVRANMHKCSLASLDAVPLRPVSVNGWRIAALWSRSYSSPHQNETIDVSARRRKSQATYLRCLQADPRVDQQDQKITSRDQRPDLANKPLIHTMYVSQRFYSYCDHDITQYLTGRSPPHTYVHLDGARLLLTSPQEASLTIT
ncbi:unnamed protein product [Sympodiomycopsis kandeliae]